VEIDWTALIAPLNGDSAILSYNLVWDAGSGSAPSINLVGYSSPYTQTSLIVTSGITAGHSYTFKYRTQNVYGWGPFSAPITIKAASIPGQMLTPTTAIENLYVKISWAYPQDNSDSVTAYDI